MKDKLRELISELRVTVDKADMLKNEIRTLLDHAERESSEPERWMPDENTVKAYGIEISMNGSIRIPEIVNPFGEALTVLEDSTNCFKSEAFALKIADRIRRILEISTLKEWLCPDCDDNYSVVYDGCQDLYIVACTISKSSFGFDLASAKRAADIMNKRYSLGEYADGETD